MILLGTTAVPCGTAPSLDEAATARRTLRESGETQGAPVLEQQADVHRQRGEYAAARQLLERALTLREEDGSAPRSIGHTRCVLGDLLWLEGRVAEARDSYAAGVAEADTTPAPMDAWFVRCLGQWGSAEVRLGDPTLGLTLHERALRVANETLGPDHSETADRLMSFANARLLLGDAEAARTLYEDGLRWVEAQSGPESNAAAERHYNIAEASVQLEDWERAAAAYARAQQIWTKLFSADHPFVALALHGRADVLVAQGHFDPARTALTEALRIHEHSEGPEHPQVGLTLASLADLYERTGDARAADAAAERALRILEPYGLAGEMERARLLALRARVALARDRPRALDAALDAEHLRTEHLRRTVRYLPEWQALDSVERSTVARDLALGSVAARPGDGAAVARAWDALIRSRTLVLDEMAARRAVAGSGDPTVQKLGDRARRAGLRLATLVHRGPGVDTKMIEAAQRELDEAQAQLGLAGASLQAAYERDHAGLREVRAALPDTSALVAFARYEPARLVGTTQSTRSEPTAGGYLAFVLAHPGAASKAVPLGDTARLDRLLSFWQACLSDVRGSLTLRYRSESECRDVGWAVTRALWDPLAPHLRRAKRVFVVPDGPLHALNLAALPLQAGGYLVESGPTLHYLTSERDLLTRPTAPARHTDLVAFAAPAFEATPQRVADAPLPAPWSQDPVRMAAAPSFDAARPVFRGSPPACAFDVPRDWPTLPGTRAETEDLLQLWSRQPGTGQAWLLEREGAGETALKLLASRARILHLATHGFAHNDACATRAAARSRDNPLLRSGVVLAGANHRDEALPGQDDGILTAEEAAGLDLDGTEWVVLSGCDTGRGALHGGDGVLGLRRAFAIAGARTVIMSLWAVDDAGTRRWMRALYEARLAQHLDTAEAVRAASLEFLRQQRERGASTHPALWAAFVASGDWR